MATLSEIQEGNAALRKNEAMLRHAMQCSPFIQRSLFSDGALLPDILQNLHQAWTEQAMRDWLADREVADEAALKHAVRKLRQQVMLRVIVRDLNGLANLQEVMQTMSSLAEVAVQFALQYLSPWQEAIYGTPLGESGDRQELIVVGMGKLGGGELNASSDIDLIFAFEEDGETDGSKPLSNLDFFTRLAKKLIAAIDEITEHGFVFRVDMRLRPYGSEGPLACSFAMLEEYYQNQGREWERYAWIKGRVIAGPGEHLANLLRPFVFRKYLDYGAFASMRDLKLQIHRDVNRRELHDDIKLGSGGIREIEFIAQVFQLIRGGSDASLQIRQTLAVLQLLKSKGLLPSQTVAELSEAYVFLRNLEHRLQYVEDAQTQALPASEAAQARIALAMNFADWATLKNELKHHRQLVEKHFSQVFSDPQQEAPSDSAMQELWQNAMPEKSALQHLQTAGYKEAQITLQRLQALHNGSRYRQLPELSHQRFDVLMPMLIEQAGQQANPDEALLRVTNLLESICRRASYLALLAEYPAALSLVVKLAAASPWLAQYLAQHPILMDELLDTESLYAAPDFAAMREELKLRLAEVEGDVERQMDVMRHFKHANVFHFAAKDIAGELSLETLSDYLSALADLILQATMEVIWPNLRGRHCAQPKFAIIGYGKLGGKELGYASDLDIIFLYDDAASEAGEIYARFGQRISFWLNSLTSAGMLYETDLQLRPDGASGLLVSSLSAFREYQLHKAWVWEHQALTRARHCAGDSAIGDAFEQIRHEVLSQPRDAAKLRADVVAMRQRMHDGHPNRSQLFDLKHDSGGIVDVEFMVQYLVLANAAKHAQLTSNAGNLALLGMAARLGLIDSQKANAVAEAYRAYRRLQHVKRLQGESVVRVPLSEVRTQAEAVRDLWGILFNAR